MNKIRIGKDIRINWIINVKDNEEEIVLTQENLTLEMTTPSKCVALLPFTFKDNTVTAFFYGIDQNQLGNYWLTLWYKRNEVGQSAVDKVFAFQLVRSTEDEANNDNSMAYADVSLNGTITIGQKGDDGVGIKNIVTEESQTEGGDNKITIELTDGRNYDFSVKNGSTTIVNVSDKSIIIEGTKTYNNF